MRRFRLTVALAFALLVLAGSAGAAAASMAGNALPSLRAAVVNSRTGVARAAVIGGHDVAAGTWPWMALVADIEADHANLCSGTVISSSVVLTAAHCVADPDVANYRIVTGSPDWTDQSQRQVSAVAQVHVYPAYDPVSHSGDAALLVLNTPSSAPTISLATPRDSGLLTTGNVLAIGGWGRTAAGLSTSLQWGLTVLQESDYCALKASAAGVSFSSSSALCTIDPSDETGVCHGDSGGPLVDPAGGTAVEVGIASWAAGDCDTDYPDFFTRADLISGWADDIVASVTRPASLGQPPSLRTLTFAEVPAEVRQAIKWTMGNLFRSPLAYARRCRRRSRTSIRCSVSWLKGPNYYYGIVRIFLDRDKAHSAVEWNYEAHVSSVNRRCFAGRHRRLCSRRYYA